MHYPIYSTPPALRHLVVAGLCGAWGVAMAVPIFADAGLPDLAEMLAFAGLGASAAGLVTAWFFGRAGRSGYGWMVLGGVLCTLLGAAIAGIAIDGPTAGVFAAYVIGGNILIDPVLSMLWVVCLLAVHLASRWLREGTRGGRPDLT